MTAATRPRLLGVFAHPDDETFCAGGSLATYVERGAEAMVVSATRGEAGQIRDAALATRRTLGESGEVDVVQEQADRSSQHLNRLGPGEFFGEVGVAHRTKRNANVIAVDAVTCLVLSPTAPAQFAGRGGNARFNEGRVEELSVDGVGSGVTTVIDVSGQVSRKVAAIAAHRTQFPIDPLMFPPSMLQDMFGREYFVRVHPPMEVETDMLPVDRAGSPH